MQGEQLGLTMTSNLNRETENQFNFLFLSGDGKSFLWWNFCIIT